MSQIVADDATVESAQCLIGTNHRKSAVLYLLQNVVPAIRLMDLRHVVFLADGGHIDVRMEGFVSESEDVGLADL